MKDLAPEIYRQRLIIEGLCKEPLKLEQIKDYLIKLGDVAEMRVLAKPLIHEVKEIGGRGGYVYWVKSGAHLYSWKKPPFFNVDIYACAAFSNKDVVQFTKDYFKPIEMVNREV